MRGHQFPSPTSPSFWRSALRGPRLTALLGVVLLGGITLLFVTGLLSYAAYNPDLAGVNDQTPDKGVLGFYLFDWPTGPHWLYRVTQGLHVTVGVALVPVLLAKLWSVIPKLFTMPPARSVGHALERVSLLLLVGGALFEFVTGLLNIQLEYLFPGSFYPLHFYGAWVFIGAFVAHVVLRMPRVVQALRERADPGAEEDDTGLVAARPGGADRLAPGCPGAGGRRFVGAARDDGGAEHRWGVAAYGVAGAARGQQPRERSQRLPDQQDGLVHRDPRAGHR